MSLHIARFVDRLKAAESRGQQDMVMTVRDARDLHADITKLLLQLQESTVVQSRTDDTPVQIQGGSF